MIQEMMKEIRKENLKAGWTVELRNGSRYLVIRGCSRQVGKEGAEPREVILVNQDGFLDVDAEYEERGGGLCNFAVEGFDIVNVYATPINADSISRLNTNDPTLGKWLVWEEGMACKPYNYINPDKMFSGKLSFLSNMHPCTVMVRMPSNTAYAFPSAEAAFQAGKCKYEKDIVLFMRAANGAEAKKIGRRIEMRPDWGTYRLEWMKQVVASKFTQNPELMEKLVNTYPLPLAETNTWGDTFWGVCRGRGENHLGKILMEIRENAIRDKCRRNAERY